MTATKAPALPAPNMTHYFDVAHDKVKYHSVDQIFEFANARVQHAREELQKELDAQLERNKALVDVFIAVVNHLGIDGVLQLTHLLPKSTKPSELMIHAIEKKIQDERAIARVQSAKLSVALDEPGARERLDAVMNSSDWKEVPAEPRPLPESMSRDEMLKYYSSHANLLSHEALQYQKRIRELEAALAAEVEARPRTGPRVEMGGNFDGAPDL